MASLKRGRTLTRPDRLHAPAPMLSGQDERRSLDPWVLFSKITTFWAPGFVLSKMGMPELASRQAWREKVALCWIIALIGGIVAFLTLGLPHVFCPPSAMTSVENFVQVSSDVPGLVGVNGFAYSASSAKNELSRFPSGSDISSQFLHGSNVEACRDPSISGYSSVQYNPCTAKEENPGCPLPPIEESAATYNLVPTGRRLGYDWVDIPKNSFVIDGSILNLTPYIKAFPAATPEDVVDGAIREVIDNGITDATRVFLRRPELIASIPCLTGKYFAGSLSKSTPGCFGVKLFFVISMVIILGIVLTRFFMAVLFDWFLSFKLARPPRLQPKHIIGTKSAPWANAGVNTEIKQIQLDSNELFTVLLVTCYSEGESSLRCTIESLAATEYSDDRKLLFIIADGIITGSGNEKSTPDICVDMVELDPLYTDPEPQSYIAVASGAKQHNMAKVYAGHFVHAGHRVPTVVVVKCGAPEEQGKPKPGNRGKRDSQLILMNFFSRVTFNDRMTPLDYDLFTKIHHLTGATPDYFEIVLMVDADTKVYPDSLRLLTNCMINDQMIMGLCGETKIANKRDSWVTAIQVFEYYISHHLGKGFESIFGGVTCLPGCFCMYRLKARKGDSDWVPIITKPEIVQEYSQNEVDTLHQKNLLLLGEDRFLTTLMLRNFPNRKMMFMPQAICKTVVPDEFSVLLSQRRRWINSTIHNLMELVLVRNLCGTFCFSMQFVVVMELIGTVSLPVAIVMTYVLIYSIATTTFTDAASYYPLILLILILFLPAVLILLTTRKLIYIAWMLVYLLALPVWNFVLPVYAYWHFDDFSWGETRKVAGETKEEDHGKKDGVFDSSKITLRRWEDYERRRLRNDKDGAHGSPSFGNGMVAQNRASVYSQPEFDDRISEKGLIEEYDSSKGEPSHGDQNEGFDPVVQPTAYDGANTIQPQQHRLHGPRPQPQRRNRQK
ncbi:hypothetical protein K493DRAFT_376454 [Basidiobolus meristosporus CBS 931.73]|uniref:chitin synthase n=1 Tax=Basidiobolus meristosporus CBS 931.73 TaxID=1314790 RepID=A0A1Y1Y467_9FUNG|nr:hypothetical protein K493DRAFT_376454 [Basidiobolus meristosporus CBS 931.73]|eukprot:ORX92685.1 hypothetical protein K493DRAFT_376454 [Basidiobolus meristosporus CBS 931.73]